MKIQGKAAVVTGASSGVGRATALALARNGCSILINYNRSQEGAEDAVREASALGVKAACFQGDVADDSACRAMMARAKEEFGRLDILVNNAGTTEFVAHDDLEAVTNAMWERIFSVNVKGVFQCARAARPFLEESGGEIVNIASVAGIAATGSSIPYCASKAAVINMTMSLARALAPKVRVNAVAPGFIDGRWTREGLGTRYDQARAGAAKRSALEDVCLPEDVAESVLSLILGSDRVTGHTLVCDAGALIGSSK